MEKIHQREKLFNRICAGVLIAFALVWLVPLLWAVDTALKPNAETTRTTWLIDSPTFDAFTRTLRDTDMWSWYGASFIVSSLAAIGTVFVASMAAFALSRMRFRYKNIVFWAILAGIMIPGQVLIVPWFREFDTLRLLNTYWAV
ncbi:MAG TPA: carbohydrate ABC transporter permease, partial [Asanoa sp.]|nr:carbohydrate ABC transporter permease [Asanoa sp.]